MHLLAGLKVTTKSVERTAADDIGAVIPRREQQQVDDALELDPPLVGSLPIPVLALSKQPPSSAKRLYLKATEVGAALFGRSRDHHRQSPPILSKTPRGCATLGSANNTSSFMSRTRLKGTVGSLTIAAFFGVVER